MAVPSRRNLVGGRSVPSNTGRTFKNTSPAKISDVVGVYPLSDAFDVDAAVAAARAALPAWRSMPAPRRGALLYAAARILEDRKEAIARVMTREMGKTLQETRGDVQEAIDTAYYAAGEGRRLFGETVPVEMPRKFGMSVRMPVGVCGLITPWNFPSAIPAWKTFPALICGNTVVLKPAEDSPESAHAFVTALVDAGIPAGVVNLVHGDGEAGRALVRHPGVDLISFTGSSEVGREVAEVCGRALRRCSLELGGKNAQVVLADADLDLALEGALWGAFGTTGQRCTATSRLILERPIAKVFGVRLAAAAKRLRLGDGLVKSTDVGPLVNEAQRERVEKFVATAVAEGARVLCGGKRAKVRGLDGYFFQPTVLDNVRPGDTIAQREVFGPVVVLLTVDSFEKAIEVLNGTDYGLSSSIYTADVRKAFHAMEAFETGITYINGPTIGAEVHLPFGGVKATGNGHREAGSPVIDVFTEWKSIYVDYSGKLQRAQIDNHPRDAN
jgi:aldehyde dehydrogenase (NAD+)